MVRLPSRRVCWWGKLPSRGDFIGRGLPPRWRSDWDAWLQRGLALAAATLDGAALRERLGGFAPWRYVALPAPGEMWCGIIVPSHDRVGRAFPLTLAERWGRPASPHESAARLASLLDAMAEGPEALEAAIAALAPQRSEPESGMDLDWPPEPASLWWPLAAAPDVAARAAAWPPEPALLLELLGVQPAAHRIASAE
jgi:type VI secretion system protein ImpM